MNNKNKEEFAAGEKKSHKVPIILVVVWVLIIVLFGYSLWQDKSDESSDDIMAGESTAVSDTANTNTASVEEMTEEQRDQALLRDTKRLSDMKLFRVTLETYRSDNGNYPETLDDLIPDYAEFLPRDPLGQPYVYTGIGSKPYTYYDMSYNLEVGAEGIEAGMHIASPNGLATP